MEKNAIINDIKDALNLTDEPTQIVIDGRARKNFYEAKISEEEKYYFAFLNANKAKNNRVYGQISAGIKSKLFTLYQKSKEEQIKFFIIGPDGESFKNPNYYIFVELLNKGDRGTNSFEYKIPELCDFNNIIRKKGPTDKNKPVPDYYISYVPAKDENGEKNITMLKHYLNCFDSRPYSKYIVHLTDFISRTTDEDRRIAKVRSKTWPNNFLIAGAPGTGKSYTVNNMIKKAIENELFYSKHDYNVEFVEEKIIEILREIHPIENEEEYLVTLNKIIDEKTNRVTFYEDYTYENFVGMYKPIPMIVEEKTEHYIEKNDFVKDDIKALSSTMKEIITYKFEPGPFLDTYIKALNNPSEIYFLIIEEINRAKAATVFGDMFQLLDRDKEGISEYKIVPDKSLDKYLSEKVNGYCGFMQLPSNMFIWATMNNADQGVFPLDSAFKRRWNYLYLDINSTHQDAPLYVSSSKCVQWDGFRTEINRIILESMSINEDKCIGAWFFKEQEFEQIKNYYECDDPEKINMMLNPLSDKLLVYLLNDVFRIDPTRIFNEEYQNMPSIRKAIQEKISLENILKLDWNKVNSYNQTSNTEADSNIETPTDEVVE